MPTLLIVDDSPTVRESVRQAFEGELTVIEADNGLKAIEAVEKNKIDLILLDSAMPVMDGATALRVIRARGHRMPVVLLTGDMKATRIAGLMALGAQDFIAKPVRLEELQRKIRGFVAPRPDAKATIGAEEAIKAPPPVAQKKVPVLLVDANETAVSRFWDSVPSFVALESRPDLASARAACSEQHFRAVVIDAAVLRAAPADAVAELRAALPKALLVGVFLKTTTDKDEAARAAGLDRGLHKPFDREEVGPLLEQLAGAQTTLDVSQNVLTLRPLPSGDDNQKAFARQLGLDVTSAIDAAAEASEIRVWLHFKHDAPMAIVKPMLDTAVGRCAALGLKLGVVDEAAIATDVHMELAKAGVRVLLSLDDID